MISNKIHQDLFKNPGNLYTSVAFNLPNLFNALDRIRILKYQQAINSLLIKNKSPLKNKAKVRPSAMKKYPGQIMMGFGYFLQRKLMEKSDKESRHILTLVNDEFLGKYNQDYKMNTILKIRQRIFEENIKDDEFQKSIKVTLKKYFEEFFEEINFKHWIDHEFHGLKLNKQWFLVNKDVLKARILHNVKLHFKDVDEGETENQGSDSKSNVETQATDDTKEEDFEEEEEKNKICKKVKIET